MRTIYRCKVTVKHPTSSQRVPSEFVDWYDYPTLEECKAVHAENMHRYGLSGEHCEAVWALCDGSLRRKTYFDHTAEEAIADFRSEHSI